MEKINKSNFSDEELDSFINTQSKRFGLDEMYYSQGPIFCFASKGLIVILMAEENYSSFRGAGGTEMKSGVYVFNEKFEMIGEIWLKPWRDRMDGDKDDWSLRLFEIVTVKERIGQVIVECTVGAKRNRKVVVSINPLKRIRKPKFLQISKLFKIFQKRNTLQPSC